MSKLTLFTTMALVMLLLFNAIAWSVDTFCLATNGNKRWADFQRVKAYHPVDPEIFPSTAPLVIAAISTVFLSGCYSTFLNILPWLLIGAVIVSIILYKRQWVSEKTYQTLAIVVLVLIMGYFYNAYTGATKDPSVQLIAQIERAPATPTQQDVAPASKIPSHMSKEEFLRYIKNTIEPRVHRISPEHDTHVQAFIEYFRTNGELHHSRDNKIGLSAVCVVTANKIQCNFDRFLARSLSAQAAVVIDEATTVLLNQKHPEMNTFFVKSQILITDWYQEMVIDPTKYRSFLASRGWEQTVPGTKDVTKGHVIETFLYLLTLSDHLALVE